MVTTAEWYWRRGTSEGGPITWDRLQTLAAAGKIGPHDQVRREGWTDWKLACQASEHDVAPGSHEVDDDGIPISHAGRMPPAIPGGFPPSPGISPMPGMPPLSGMPSLGNPAPRSAFGAPPPLPTASAATLSTAVLSSQISIPKHFANRGDDGPAPVPNWAPPITEGYDDTNSGRFNGTAVGSLVTSLAGLLFLALPMGIIALALGAWSLVDMKNSGDSSGKCAAVAGLAVGALDVAAWLIYMAVQAHTAAAGA
jgi:hypothetical protein